MNAIVALILVPLTILAVGIYLATKTDDPMWLVFSAVLAMGAGYIARRGLGG